MLFARVAVMVMLLGPGCANIAPTANRTVSEQTSGEAIEVALVKPTIAPALRPAAPAVCCACARAWATTSARLQAGACCAETRVPDNVKERESPLLFCEIDFCNEVSAAVVSFSLEKGTAS